VRPKARRIAPRLAVLAAAALPLAWLSIDAGAAGARPSAGWILSVEVPTSSTPSWAYPFAPADEYTTSNVEGFEQLMYRPLYFFGANATVALNQDLSLATPPVYSHDDTTVAITMRPGLRWSNGESVTAADVVDWLNLDAAFPSAWADDLAPVVAGQHVGIPDDIRAVAVSGQTITLTLAGPVDPTWFTYSELSQLTPLPVSWDRYEPTHPRVPLTGPASISGNGGNFTGATASAGCNSARWIGDGNDGPSSTFVDPLGQETVVTAANVAQAQRCVDVVELMRSASADTANYTMAGTDVASLFDVSDGPWRLLSYNAATGSITFAPNTVAGASGNHATAHRLDLVPCTTATACLDLLQSGRVDQGILPLADAPATPSLASAPGHNPLHKDGYTEHVTETWTTSFMPYNFDSTLGADRHAGRVFQQLYFRQAFQSLVDQPAWIAQDLHGYGVQGDAPVPIEPPSAFSHLRTNPYPFDVADAATLLTHHGWHVDPTGITTCAIPAKCGAGIPRGTPLSFTIEFAPSSPALTAMLRSLHQTAARVGISLALTETTTTALLDDVVTPNPGWDLASWDGGWSFAPDYYPSGEWVFAQGAPWNVGSYNDPTANQLVLATLTQPNELATYESYLADQLPVVWLPSPVQLLETRSSIRDVQPSPLETLTPETWRQEVSGRSRPSSR
jgi:peptide/nickel transport system substrate-binding protein